MFILFRHALSAITWLTLVVDVVIDISQYTMMWYQRKRAPGSARGGACGYNLSHDQLSSVDQQYKNCDPYTARLG